MATYSPSAQLPRIGQGSLTEQATRALLLAILDRRFPNDKLPNEPDLADQLGVSRTTVRAAMQTLERLGVITRAPGRGTLIRAHIGRDCMMLHRLIGFRGALEARYEDVRVEQSFSVQSHGSAAALDTLGVGVDTPIVRNDKTYYADGRPAVHLLQEVPLHFISADFAKQIMEGSDFETPATIFEFSAYWPGREIDHSVVELVPEVAPLSESSPLPIPLKPGTPYLALHEVHYSEANEAIAYSRDIVDDAILRMRLVRAR